MVININYIKHLVFQTLFVCLGAFVAGCSSVAPYQKMYLNDQDMELNSKEIEYFEGNFQTYREGASGANGGKTGGGCGCN